LTGLSPGGSTATSLNPKLSLVGLAVVGILTVLGAAIYLQVYNRPPLNLNARERLNPIETPADPARVKDTGTGIVVLAGIVVDNNDKPIQGAAITIDEMPGMESVETSSDGVFTVNDVPRKYGEAVRIRVVKEGYRPNPYTEDVILGKTPPRVRLRKEK
jgi:hypothetical protein